jgi:uncharacterized RDD family membrane protein YckC
MDWFYADAGRQVGPIDEATFQNLASAGIVKDDTLVWRAGMATWQPYRTIHAPPQPPPLESAGTGALFCSECGKPYPADELAAFGSSMICAACKPIFTQKLREGIRPAGAVRYGGFWLRYLAAIVDSTLLSVVLYIIGIIAVVIALAVFGIKWIDPNQPQAELTSKIMIGYGFLILLSLILSAVYETWMVTKYGATLGKMVCQLRVVMSDGSKISYARSLGRHFGKYLSGFTLYIGYIMAGFDDEKRALHDRICDTRVIKK